MFCDDIPVAMKCASVSRCACRKRRRRNSPCMRVEVLTIAGRKWLPGAHLVVVYYWPVPKIRRTGRCRLTTAEEEEKTRGACIGGATALKLPTFEFIRQKGAQLQRVYGTRSDARHLGRTDYPGGTQVICVGAGVGELQSLMQCSPLRSACREMCDWHRQTRTSSETHRKLRQLPGRREERSPKDRDS
jgi:hypothetical protein